MINRYKQALKGRDIPAQAEGPGCCVPIIKRSIKRNSRMDFGKKRWSMYLSGRLFVFN
jgi:hypothetical protein